MARATMTEPGLACALDDPKRAVWYSARCTFWTDDWSRLALVGPGIPCCPHCKCPGMQTDWEDWMNGVEGYDAKNPGYKSFIMGLLDKCSRKENDILKVWNSVKMEKSAQDSSVMGV